MNYLSYFLNPANWFFPPSRRYRLEVHALESEVSKIKDFAQAICTVAGYSLADSNVIKLVLEEVCVNIIRHAYTDNSKGPILVEMSIGFFGMRIKVMDQGKSFDFKSVKDPDLEHYVDVAKKGGLGLWVIRKMMTNVRYRSFGDHNEWTLHYCPTKESEDEEKKIPAWDGLSVKFTLASFFLFTFLIFLVYVLTVLVTVPALGPMDTLARRLGAGYATTLGRGIVLVYGLGLAGFALIFYKLFHPLVSSRDPRTNLRDRWKVRQTYLKDRAEYERLLTVLTEMEQNKKELQKQNRDRDSREAQMLEEQKLAMEKVALLEAQLEAEKNAAMEKVALLEAEKNAAVIKTEKSRTPSDPIQRMSTVEEEERAILTGSDPVKLRLEKELEDAQVRIRHQEHFEEGIRKEVQVAQQIQHALLPKEYPQIEGFQVGASYRAASEVGGDYYDFIWVDPTTLGIAVGDVAGKGVPGSMVMAMIRTAMRLEAKKNKSPANVLLKVHQHVNGDMKRGMFATMFYIVLDSRHRSISYASAGHNPMVLYRGSTDEVYFLKPKGFPLGIDLPDESLFAKTMALQKLSLQKDDLLLIYTDGVTEAMNAKREQFGEERMIQAVRDNARLPATEIVAKIEESIARFVGNAEQSDDVTIVVIKENLQAEDVIYKFRKQLLKLVEDGASIAEACRQMNVSPQTYYYYKAIHDKKGDAGLKPVFPKKRAAVNELSLDQRNAVLSVVRSNPELGAGQIVEFLKSVRRPSIKLDTKVVAEFLNRKGLGEAKERKVFAANEIDTV